MRVVTSFRILHKKFFGRLTFWRCWPMHVETDRRSDWSKNSRAQRAFWNNTSGTDVNRRKGHGGHQISNMDEEPTTSTELEPVPCSSDSERHPWPYLSKLFEFKGSKNDSWRFQCVKCLPQRKELLAFKNSPSNLKKHIEVRHAMLVINI